MDMRGSLQAWAVVVVLAACGNVGGQDCVPSFLSGIGGFNGDPQTGPAYDVEIHNGVAYVAAGTGGLFTVDVSDPASISLLGSVKTPGAARAVAVAGTVAYIADNTSGLTIIDISDPSSPSLLGSFPTFQARDVAVEDPHLAIRLQAQFFDGPLADVSRFVGADHHEQKPAVDQYGVIVDTEWPVEEGRGRRLEGTPPGPACRA